MRDAWAKKSSETRGVPELARHRRLRRGGELRVVLRVDADLVGLRRLVLELHDAVDEGEDRVVAAEADVLARVILGAILADDDVARDDLLAAVLLDAEEFRIAVAAVAR